MTRSFDNFPLRSDLHSIYRSNCKKALTYANILMSWDVLKLRFWNNTKNAIFSLVGIRTSPLLDGDWCFLRVQVTRFPPRIGCCKPPEDGLLRALPPHQQVRSQQAQNPNGVWRRHSPLRSCDDTRKLRQNTQIIILRFFKLRLHWDEGC